MKAFVDGNKVGLVNDDFVDIQQSDVVWVDRLDAPRPLKCVLCFPTMRGETTLCEKYEHQLRRAIERLRAGAGR